MRLELKHISKSYDDKKVLEDISLELTEGVYGLLGPNGAGKTTLLNIICRLLKSSKGEIFFNGKPQSPDYYQYLGFLPQHFSYYPSFTGLDFLLYLADLKGMKKHEAKKESEKLLDLVGLSDVKKKKIASYSGGMKQRLGIAQSLLGNPKILILDEPTVGLDPKERIRFRNLISELSSNRIVILSTHIVSDLEAIAKEILILKDRKIREKGSGNQLLSLIEGKSWEVLVSEYQRNHFVQQFVVVNERVLPEGTLLRIVSDERPSSTAQAVAPSLEDLYLYYFREGAFL
ncbi:ABC transporter ATP-binding protein [Streptococcus himalayensis]|uniref:ABC transporter ATP-binding protein n=1 Tax=Streptococcus himalayensis TaxID=1888195 RepID=A0A917EEJ9_9STRE|nr:ABC transporter ATP-binding protein [Streptococcus himalayensis]GGE29066.1 ABC transporter ATP-binding protein [Streptococcus himalayensis]